MLIRLFDMSLLQLSLFHIVKALFFFIDKNGGSMLVMLLLPATAAAADAVDKVEGIACAMRIPFICYTFCHIII